MSKYKITLVDCENFDNNISIFIDDVMLTMSEDIRVAVEHHKGMGKSQITKINMFADSCHGPFMVNGHYYNENFCKEVYYKEGTYGYIRVYRGGDYMHIFNCTYVQGHKDTAYRIPVEEYKDIENIRELIERMDFNGEDKAGSLERIYSGEKVW